MKTLVISYIDADGGEQRASVDSDSFVIGRVPENDLAIGDTRISRKHLRIFRENDDYFAEELGSSNGSRINGSEIIEPVLLHEGDELDLGGVCTSLTFSYDDEPEAKETEDEKHSDSVADKHASEAIKPASSAPNKPEPGFNIFKLFAVLLVMGVLLLLLVGGGLLAYKLMQPAEEAATEDVEIGFGGSGSSDVADDASSEVAKTSQSNPASSQVGGASAGSASTSYTRSTSSGNPSGAGELPADDPLRGVEQAAVSFMRRIAKNDPNPVITSQQTALISDAAKKFQGSSALAANIANAQKNSSEITSIASAKNIRPQFLVTAALAKLGPNQGDVVSVAREMSDVFDKLNIQIGDETVGDSLVMVAAFQQGTEGEFLKMRNTLERLSTDNPTVSSRQVRTIWFLRDKNSISPAEFDFALRYLAIGTITQNPKQFGVNSQALNF